MDLLQAILQAGGGSAVQQMAASHGLSNNQVESVLGQLVPALAGGISHQVQQEGGLGGLLGALTGGQHQQYMDNPATLTSEEAVADGNGILGHIFGSKDVSRHVATQAAASTGVSSDIIKKMLPMVAALAMGAMSQRVASSQSSEAAPSKESGGGIGDVLGGALGSVLGGSSGGLGGALGGMLGQAMGGGAKPGGAGGSLLDMLAPMLTGGGSAGGSNMAGEVMGMLGKMMGGGR